MQHYDDDESQQQDVGVSELFNTCVMMMRVNNKMLE